MPILSIVIPAYNNSRFLPECVSSVLSQDFRDIEIIIVDDASTDDTPAIIDDLKKSDSRIRAIRHELNQGTLAARSTGVQYAQGAFTMFIDQDDGLRPGTLSKLVKISHQHPADIYHFGVQVKAANAAAQEASAGMSTFLNPTPRTIHGEAILQIQFSEVSGFDWHLHHKMFRTELVQRAYRAAEHTRLLLSDDLYMNFIIDSLACEYIAVPDSPWYFYHLGRGDTLGSTLSIPALHLVAQRDAKALALIRQFVESSAAPARADWDERTADARDRLIEHTMNEWKDNLPDTKKHAGLIDILACWQADTVAGELYRYTRDYAYAYLQQPDKTSSTAVNSRKKALEYLEMARHAERGHQSSDSHNQRYQSMKAIAEQHLKDSRLVTDPPQQPTTHRYAWIRHLFN